MTKLNTDHTATPTEDITPEDRKEMSQVGPGECWYAPAYGVGPSLKPHKQANVLFLHHLRWSSRHHSDPDCQALFEIAGTQTVLLPVRTAAEMFTVGLLCPRCGEMLLADDINARLEVVRVTRKAFLAAHDVHASPATTQ